MDTNEKILAGLSDETRAKLAACATPEDILSLAKEEGYELSDEQIEQISGGWDCFRCRHFACQISGGYL